MVNRVSSYFPKRWPKGSIRACICYDYCDHLELIYIQLGQLYFQHFSSDLSVEPCIYTVTGERLGHMKNAVVGVLTI